MSNITYHIVPDPNPSRFGKLAEAMAAPIQAALGRRRIWNISEIRLPSGEAKAYMKDLIQTYMRRPETDQYIEPMIF